MRLLHASFFTEIPTGVRNQLNSEIVAAENIGLNLETRVVNVTDKATDGSTYQINSKSKIRLNRWLETRYKYARWLIAQQHNYDAVLLRWGVSDPFFAYAINRLKCPVFTIHHTKEPDELALSAYLGNVRKHVDNITFRNASKNLSGIIGVTKEILDFEKSRAHHDVPGYVHPNGIRYSDELVLSDKIGDNPVTEIVFVASHFAKWHGLELLLDSLKTSSKKFKLNIIGKVEKSTLSSVKDPRVIFHGSLDKEKLNQIYSKCDVGLTTFSLDRLGLKQACTLKCREYLMHGLPVYSGYEDVFPQSFKYYKMGKPEIGSILEFVEQHAGTKKSIISKAARPYIDKEILLRNLYDWVEQTVSKQ